LRYLVKYAIISTSFQADNQITLIFYRLDALPDAQTTVLKR